MDWFLYDNGLRHERVKQNGSWNWEELQLVDKEFLTLY